MLREMTQIICSGNCLQECELRNWSGPKEPRGSNYSSHTVRNCTYGAYECGAA